MTQYKLTFRDHVTATASTLGLGFLLWAILTAIAAAQISVPLVRVEGASGTLIARDRVITAYHVVAGSRSISCRFDFLPGVRRTKLQTLAYSPEHRRDIAIFTIAPVDATPITIASTIPRVGETVHVAGYAPDGRISSTGRMLGMQGGSQPRMMLGVSINLGDSGGCVLNSEREFVGVLCAKDTGGNRPGRTAYASPVTTDGPWSRWLGGDVGIGLGGGIGIGGGGSGGCPNCPPGQCPQEQGGSFGQWRQGRQGRDSIVPGPYQDSPLTPDPPPGHDQLVPIPPRQQQPPIDRAGVDELKKLIDNLRDDVAPRQQPPPPSISGDCQRQLNKLKRQIAALDSGSAPDCSDCLSQVAVLQIEVTTLRTEVDALREAQKGLLVQFAEFRAECRKQIAPPTLRSGEWSAALHPGETIDLPPRRYQAKKPDGSLHGPVLEKHLGDILHVKSAPIE